MTKQLTEKDFLSMTECTFTTYNGDAANCLSDEGSEDSKLCLNFRFCRDFYSLVQKYKRIFNKELNERDEK
ncbi:MAG: hypothetical protein DRP02_14605 [Candidatus Gerdarchaeota archaeon]|nr:MAG: hypothetical protein DRP02_14605 [Candidatus Gerdarchaeota archaeon]